MFPLVFAIFIDNLNFSGSYPLITGMFKVHADVLFADQVAAPFIDLCMSLAYLAFPLGMLFSTAIIEDFSHFFGKKKTVLLSLFGIGAGFCLMAIAVFLVNIWLFLIGRLLTGMMSGLQPIAGRAISEMGQEKEENIKGGILTFSIMLGVAIGPLIGGVFADHALFIDFNYSLPFFITAALSFLAMAILYFGGEKLETEGKTPTFKLDFLRKELAKLYYDGRIRWLFFIFFLFQFGFATYYQFMLVKLSLEFNYLIIDLGFFAALIGLGFVVASITLLPKIAKIGADRFLSPFLLALTGIIMALSAYVHSPIWLSILAFCIAVTDLTAYTATLAHFSSYSLAGGQKVALGLAMFAVILGWLFSSLLANLILEIDIDHVLALGAFAILASALFMGFYTSRYRLVLK